MDLLRVGLERPHLRKVSATRNQDQQDEYEIYALMVWSFVETIHDRAMSDPELLETWRSAMDIENNLHRAWFDRQEEYKFKPAFRHYIHETFRTITSTAKSPQTKTSINGSRIGLTRKSSRTHRVKAVPSNSQGDG
jgi:hypothetical protein